MEDIKKIITDYQIKHKEQDISQLIDFLNNNKDYLRTNKTGHLTASSWIVNKDKTKALMIFHKKYNQWLQAGGHIEINEKPLDTAIREAKEELGIQNINILDFNVFDIDIHPIPENIKKNEPKHFHYDLRFVMTIDDQNLTPDSTEVKEYKWVDFEELKLISKDSSVLRLIEKTILIL